MKKLFYFIVSLLVLGICYEQYWRYVKDKEFTRNSLTYSEVDGSKIHFDKKGTGSPSIVFVSGLGNDYMVWKEIQDSLSKYTTTISYDRAGLLYSEETNQNRTIYGISNNLKQLLENEKVAPPYILVGHSIAGIYLRAFIRDYGENIASVLLIESSHPREFQYASEELINAQDRPSSLFVKLMLETGFFRCYYRYNSFIPDIPPCHWLNVHYRNFFYKSFSGAIHELDNMNEMSNDADKIKTFGNIPLLLISGKYPNGSDFLKDNKLMEEFLKLRANNQKDLLKLSEDSRLIFAFKSSHYIQIQEPDLLISLLKEEVNKRKLDLICE